MLQDQDFGSDSSDDDDYVPTNEGRESGNNLSSGPEESDGELFDDPIVKPSGQGKSKKKKSLAKPKSNRRANPLLAQLQQNTVDDDTEKDVECAVGEQSVNKVEDIWADFLADTEEKKEQIPKPKKKSWAALLGNAKSKPVPVTSVSTTAACTSSSSSSSSASSSSTVPSSIITSGTAPTFKISPEAPTTVKITKIFQFAGEEVRVEEEVAADSSEAVAAAAAAAQKISSTSHGSGVPVKRSSGLAGLVSNLEGKKQRLSTLEKTKLDWQSYKQKEGLEDELLLHTKSKDTYIDKQEFLQRADVRQFEHEREVRLGSRRANR